MKQICPGFTLVFRKYQNLVNFKDSWTSQPLWNHLQESNHTIKVPSQVAASLQVSLWSLIMDCCRKVSAPPEESSSNMKLLFCSSSALEGDVARALHPAGFLCACNNILQWCLWGGCFFNCKHKDFCLAGAIFLRRIKIREAAICQALKDCACSQLILLCFMCVLDIGASELQAIFKVFLKFIYLFI